MPYLGDTPSAFAHPCDFKYERRLPGPSCPKQWLHKRNDVWGIRGHFFQRGERTWDSKNCWDIWRPYNINFLISVTVHTTHFLTDEVGWGMCKLYANSISVSFSKNFATLVLTFVLITPYGYAHICPDWDRCRLRCTVHFIIEIQITISMCYWGERSKLCSTLPTERLAFKNNWCTCSDKLIVTQQTYGIRKSSDSVSTWIQRWSFVANAWRELVSANRSAVQNLA